MSRNEERNNAMTILYQIGLYRKNNISYDVRSMEFVSDYVRDIVCNVDSKFEELDGIANKYLDNWKIDRLGFTDGAILRIAIYEIMYTDTPNKVCINEAIELAKKYSDDSVVKMINGVLDKVYHNEVVNGE